MGVGGSSGNANCSISILHCTTTLSLQRGQHTILAVLFPQARHLLIGQALLFSDLEMLERLGGRSCVRVLHAGCAST